MPKKAYLQPYFDAVARHGDGFESLLWARPQTQEARFDALARACTLHGKFILDAGCGRADLLEWMRVVGMFPKRYVGLEAVEPLYRAAAKKRDENTFILQGDFLADPNLLDQSADTILFCGSLNTLSSGDFYRTLSAAWDCLPGTLAFNFLASPKLAAADYLTWQPLEDVLRYVRTFGGEITVIEDYLDGDCAIAVRRD